MSDAAPAAVAVVLVSHDGSRWLPTVLEGLAAQSVRPARVVGVDTGSLDDSAALLATACDDVLVLPSATTYPAAVRAGVDRLPAEVDWVWLLHDDSTPAPDALELLLAEAVARPTAALFGPKLREWPSLRRLLEVGVTLSATGRRETGLERGEYDQGQHDEVRPVLAVNTAGLLVRRDVWDSLGGLDDELPVFANDLDLGWRAAAAGHQCLVVPRAVVFHAEAATRGLRRTPLTGRHPRFHQRRAAVFTLLANASARAFPLLLVRLVLGTLVRMLGLLLVRAPGEAVDEFAALVDVYRHPGRLHRARARRAAERTAPPQLVRRLLPPPWLPYRHGLDVVGDLVSAALDQAGDVAERRRAAAAAADPESLAARPRGVDPDDEDAPEAESGWLVGLLTNPVALALVAVLALALAGARAALGDTAGGALSPTPGSTADWWRLYADSSHVALTGSAVPGPAYLLPLAALSLLVGPGGAVGLVLGLAVPIAVWGAWRFLRVAGRVVDPGGMPRWVLWWGAATAGLVPATSGAFGDGRLGPVVAGALLPWLAHAALGFGDPESERRWRAGWRVALLTSVLAAFSPVLWLALTLVAALGLGVAARVVPGLLARRDRSGPVLLGVLAPLVLLLPWWGKAALDAPAALLLEPGRLPQDAPTGLDLLTGHLPGLGMPGWWGAVPLVLAVVGLVPRATRVPVLAAWGGVAVVLLLGLALAPVRLDLAAVSVPPATGALVPLVTLLLVAAATLGALGWWHLARAHGRRPLLAVPGVLLALAPLAGALWSATDTDVALGHDTDPGIPAYMLLEAESDPGRGVLVLRGSTTGGVDYLVRRGAEVTVGRDEVIALTPEDAAFTRTVERLVASPDEGAVRALAADGIGYVVAPAPADGEVAATLDATTGLVQASADPGTRAWQVGPDPTRPTATLSWPRRVLLGAQLLALLAVAVLALPQLRAQRVERAPRSRTEASA